jgi:hypothetical protein
MPMDVRRRGGVDGDGPPCGRRRRHDPLEPVGVRVGVVADFRHHRLAGADGGVDAIEMDGPAQVTRTLSPPDMLTGGRDMPVAPTRTPTAIPTRAARATTITSPGMLGDVCGRSTESPLATRSQILMAIPSISEGEAPGYCPRRTGTAPSCGGNCALVPFIGNWLGDREVQPAGESGTPTAHFLRSRTTPCVMPASPPRAPPSELTTQV